MFKDGGTGQSDYAPFINKTRSDVYSLSPYDESLVIDCDYFVMSNTLDQVWGSENDFMINCQYRDVAGRHGGNVSYIDDFSIPMYWATVFYFKKSEYTENLFSLIEHIKDPSLVSISSDETYPLTYEPSIDFPSIKSS